VAGIANGDDADAPQIATAIREPGGGWGPATETPTAVRSSNGVAVGVSDRGDALVAYATTPQDVVHIQAMRRAPGTAFGPPEELFVRKGIPQSPTVLAGMTASGEAVVAWGFAPTRSGLRELWVSIAAPGASFMAPVRVGRLRHGLPFDLAVGADGRMLLAFVTGNEIRVAERPPGGAFGAPTVVTDATDPVGAFITAALGADGAAVVAWQRLWTGRIDAVVRDAPGAFAAPGTVARRTVDVGVVPLAPFSFLVFEGDATSEFTSGGGVSGDRDAGFPRAEILAGGRALLTWADTARRDAVDWTPAVRTGFRQPGVNSPRIVAADTW
jgi:hypothetical protein